MYVIFEFGISRLGSLAYALGVNFYYFLGYLEEKMSMRVPKNQTSSFRTGKSS